MIKKIIQFALFILFASPALAQLAPVSGYCDKGGTQALTSGLPSSNYLQGNIPSCTVTVYLTGTLTKATIYLDGNTPLTNPFTATIPGSGNAGYWQFYAAVNQGLDVVLSGGIPPNTYLSPITKLDLFPSNGNPLPVGCTQATAGNLTCQTVTASVNTQINVMAPPFNAKGDCITDDHNAIQAALTAAAVYAPQAQVVFPKPPGGCYLTSTLEWNGVSLIGMPPIGIQPAPENSGIIIRGKPSEDVLHECDPNSCTVAPTASWAIRDLVIQADDSVDASANFPHRWPGRWYNDAAMTATSAILTSTGAEITCGDVGQAILVRGAGVGGSDLVTTIASVSPCWRTSIAKVITLAAAASTTVTGAYVYISVLNLPVTAHIGNCGLAADNYDGNYADWTVGSVTNNSDEMTNVKFTAYIHNEGNNSCGMFFQGFYVPYKFVGHNVWTVGEVYGTVEGVVDTNPNLAAAGGDFQNWYDGFWFIDTYPWISYDGGYNHLYDTQIDSTNGPQVLQAGSAVEFEPSSWQIRMPEMEGNSNTGIGWRIEGEGMVGEQMSLCASGSTAYLDAINSNYYDSNCVGTLILNGTGNNITFGEDITNTTIVDHGAGNTVFSGPEGNPPEGRQTTVVYALTKSRGLNFATGQLNNDFLIFGNGLLPTPSYQDLFFLPEDMTSIGSGALITVTTDLTVPLTNRYITPAGYLINAFTEFPSAQAIIGTQIPAEKGVVSLSVACATSTPGSIFTVYAGSTPVATSNSFTCGTTYSTQSVVADFTSYTGQLFGYTVSTGGTPKVAWAGIAPYFGALNLAGPFSATTLTLSGSGCTSGTYAKGDGTGCGPGGSAASLPFSAVTTGSNTTATMTVGSGAALGPTGTGTVNANLWIGIPPCTGSSPSEGNAYIYTALSSPNPCLNPSSPSGSGNTTSTSLTTTVIPEANGANSIINSPLTDCNPASTPTCIAGPNIIKMAQDTTYTGAIALSPNTTITALSGAPHHFWLIAPNLAPGSLTAFGWQFPTATNSAAGLVHVGANSSAVSQLTVSPVALTDLATQGANTFLANCTASTAQPSACAYPTTAHGVWLGNGTDAGPNITAAGAVGTVLQGQGSSADPAFGAVTSTYVDSSVVTDSGHTSTTANQIAVGTGTAGQVKFIDYPAPFTIPAANCVSGSGGAAWSTSLTASCRAGTYNLGGYLPFADSNTGQFQINIPADWDSASTSFARVNFTTGVNTTGTIIFTVAISCYATNNSATDDEAFQTAQTFSTITATNANYANTASLTLNGTSLTGCVAGGGMIIKITRATDTASSVVPVTGATITLPRLVVLQAE